MGSNSSGCGHTSDLDRGVKSFSVRIISTASMLDSGSRMKGAERLEGGQA